jgi:hypothetical protein
MFSEKTTNTKSRTHIGVLEVTVKLLSLIFMYTVIYILIDQSPQTTLQTLTVLLLPIIVSMMWLIYYKKALSISNFIDTTYQIVAISFPFLIFFY